MTAYQMSLSTPAHTQNLYKNKDIKGGNFSEIGAAGLSLALNKVKMPEQVYFDAINCTDTFLVIGVDPLYVYDNKDRSDNFEFIPIRRKCMGGACIGTPDYLAGGMLIWGVDIDVLGFFHYLQNPRCCIASKIKT
jgi:hypothetical protein